MSQATHPQFPKTGIPEMLNIVTLEITFWPHGKMSPAMTLTEEALVVGRETLSMTEESIRITLAQHPLGILPHCLIKEKGKWQCEWFKDYKHDVAVCWRKNTKSIFNL